MDVILLVQSEATDRSTATALASAGLPIRVVQGVDAALAAVERILPRVVLLDVDALPDDWRATLARLRERFGGCLVLLSAPRRVALCHAALGVLADDYVTKPVAVAELMARVRAALARPWAGTAARATGELAAGDLVVDVGARTVVVDGRSRHLTRRELAILQVLATRPGEIVSPEELLRAVWGTAEHIDRNALAVHVCHIRRKLGEDARHPRRLHTVPGAGYRLDPVDPPDPS